MKKAILPICVSGFVVVIDQLVKGWLSSGYVQGDEFVLIPHFLEFYYLHNDGAAMGMFSGMRWPLIVLTATVLIGIVLYLLFGKCGNVLTRYGLCLIVGGGFGNLIDRIFLGYVIDYVRFPVSWFHYSFNIADCAVCVGAGLIIFDLILDFCKQKSYKQDS